MKTLFYNGNIITMNDQQLQVEALLIEDSYIVGVGKEHDLRSMMDKDDCFVDLQGYTLLPGFIDPHSHFVGFANSLSQCDLSNAKSFEDIQSLLRNFINEHHIPKGEWVYGSHYDHNDLIEKKHPDKNVLDAVSMEHPIVIVHASSHMGVANSLALASQNINNSTLDPLGGKYGRMDNGDINGYMEENAFIEFQNKAPMIGIERLMTLIVEAQDIYASYGITTIQDGMVGQPLFELLHYAASHHILKQDIVGFVDIAHCKDLLIQNKTYKNKYHNHLKLGGFKTFLDGSPQGRTAWMLTPYINDDSYYGYPILTDKQLYAQIYDALSNHQQLLAHCNGDAAAKQYITQFKKVLNDYPHLDACRPVMIHAQLVLPEQLEEMKEIGMIPSFFNAHTYYWGDIHIANFSKERANKISPANSAVKLGMPYTFHQDSPVLYPDMMKTIWCAVNRITKNGVMLGKEECVNVLDALKGITVYPAYQYGEEKLKGTLDVGKIADFIIMDKNPLNVDKQLLDTINVNATFKEGHLIYEKKQ